VLSAAHGAWSLNLLSGDFWYQALLFSMLAVAALGLLAGQLPRVAALTAWVLLVSIHNRQPLIVTGADILLRTLLFWAVLLPLPWWRPGAERDATHGNVWVCSVASGALLIQIALVYVFSVVFKLQDASWMDLSAIERSLQVTGVATDLGRRLLAWPSVLSWLTAATLIIECLAPILAFWPWKIGPTRTLLVFGMIAFHCLGIGAVMDLGLFEYVMAVAWLAFLPPWFWDRLARWRAALTPSVAAPLQHEPQMRTLESGAPVNAFAAFAFCLVLSSNIDSLDERGPTGPGWAVARTTTRTLALSQNWRLWSTPLRNRYYVFPACLEDGALVDLHTQKDLDWSQPRRRSANNHWWKYQHLVSSHPHGRRLIAGYADYLIREWDAAHPERAVLAIELYRVDASASLETPGGERAAESAEDAPRDPHADPSRMPRRLLFRRVASGGRSCAHALRAASAP
jgi:hypothetical protein